VSTVTDVTASGRQPPAVRPSCQLKKNPHVELQDGAIKRDYTAREVTGDEKAVWWERAVEAWPDYAKYQTRTDRQIPVFVLESMD
jgi:deazaflavin-dependent oxidoreductase (nitroreductase family)